MRLSYLRLSGLLGLSLVLACQSNSPYGSSASRHLPRTEPVDAEHYSLDLRLFPQERRLEGTCTVSFVAREAGVSWIDLDLLELDVSSVREVGGGDLQFRQSAGRLRVELGRELAQGELCAIQVDYSGRPVKGLWFVEDGEGEVYQVFTQGECIDARAWYPCLDYPADRATSELRVELPGGWTSIAAGERIDSGESGGRHFEHWRMSTPHSTYLTTLCAGELHTLEGDWDGIPLSFHADERFAEWMPASFEQTDEVLGFLSEATGRRYPYAKYAQTCVANFPFGGMENISATTLTESTLGDARSQRDGDSHGLVAHEAAHQWFGDLLTCADWSHIWLNEGFATYFTLLYLEHSRGADEFRAAMRDTQSSYTGADIGQNRRPTVHDVYRDPMDLFFGGQAYPGGASRLHYLRYFLGDELFFAGIRRYVADNEGRSVETDDLRRALESVSGQDLSQVFAQWFYRAGYPELEVDWSWDEPRGLVVLEVDQVQRTDQGTPKVFRFDVPVELRVGAERQVVRLSIDERSEVFELPASEEPVWVRFDKFGWLPARVASKKSGREWVAIAAEDDDVNGRRDAVDALGALLALESDPVTRRLYLTALVSRLREDKSAAVRRAAVASLGRAPEAFAAAYLAKAAESDADAGVRAASLRELADYGPSRERADLALRAFEEGYSWNVMIAAAGLYAAASPPTAHYWLLEEAKTPSPHGRLQAGLIQVLSGLESPEVLADLKRFAADRTLPPQAREAAADALGRRGKYDREARDVLLGLLDQPDYRLRQAGIRNLGALRDGSVVPRLREELAESPHSRERRTLEEALERLAR